MSADWLLVLLLMLPVMGVLAIVAAGEARAEPIALGTIAATCLVAALTAGRILTAGQPLSLALAGFAPPLGLGLRADGPSAVLLTVSAVVMAAVGLFATAGFRRASGADGVGGRRPFVFWCLLLSLWSGLNAVAIGRDLFNLYVALELLTFAAVPLVCLDGRAETLAAALRYLMVALLGSMLYLLGTAILYAEYGVLDIASLAAVIRPGRATTLALAVMTVGLLAKAALVPLHLWLPAAHSGAPPAASAVLSALVVKAPFFLLLRLWFEVAPDAVTLPAGQLLGGLGGVAVLLCGALALRQVRLKLLIAYSTAAQIGYLFLVFALAAGSAAPWSSLAATGAMLQLASHAFAKAAMFMAAGTIAATYGHDRIAGLAGFGRVLPVSALALALGGLSLIGLPPSGGFNAKWLLMGGAVARGHWAIALVILAGGLLAAGYILPLIRRALAPPVEKPGAAWSHAAQLPALALALAAILTGMIPLQPLAFLAIGNGAAGAATP